MDLMITTSHRSQNNLSPWSLYLLPTRQPGQENQEDTASQDSYSVLSEDSNPPRVLHHTLLLTPEDEERFFEKLYDVVKRGFDIWKEKYEGKVLKFEDYDECVVDFEEFYDEWVTLGKRDDESGFWTGHVRLGDGHEIYKLDTGWKIILGVSMGGIRGFDCRGAGLYAAEDGFMYYSPVKGWFDQDEETGVLTIPVFGP